MSEWSEDVVDALLALDADDKVAITTDREAGGLELSGYVVEAIHSQTERFDGVWSPGGLNIGIELDNDTVEYLQSVDWIDTATHSISIHGKESRPGRWRYFSTSIWDPEVEDGTVVADDWTDLGEVTDVEVEDGG